MTDSESENGYFLRKYPRDNKKSAFFNTFKVSTHLVKAGTSKLPEKELERNIIGKYHAAYDKGFNKQDKCRKAVENPYRLPFRSTESLYRHSCSSNPPCKKTQRYSSSIFAH